MVEGQVDASEDVVRQQTVVINRVFANNIVIEAVEDNDTRKEKIKGYVGKAINEIRHCLKTDVFWTKMDDHAAPYMLVNGESY
jgi:hypothetical protein